MYVLLLLPPCTWTHTYMYMYTPHILSSVQELRPKSIIWVKYSSKFPFWPALVSYTCTCTWLYTLRCLCDSYIDDVTNFLLAWVCIPPPPPTRPSLTVTVCACTCTCCISNWHMHATWLAIYSPTCFDVQHWKAGSRANHITCTCIMYMLKLYLLHTCTCTCMYMYSLSTSGFTINFSCNTHTICT